MHDFCYISFVTYSRSKIQRSDVKLVYILDINGKPLMPTERHGKIRRLLKEKKAKVVRRCPFVVQLLYEPQTEITQDISLGVDAGSKHIGLSATTQNKVLFEADVQLRTDIVENISLRRTLRRGRRGRKTRYRKARFLNRVKSKKKGWLAPSVRQKVDCHLNMVQKVHKFLPISEVIAEVASFDIQKIKNPEISGAEYQQGEQLGFWNVREYVLFRDGHECQCCHGKSNDKVLNVHHIESRQTGGDAPNNLITLCKTCHQRYHQGKIKLPERIKRGMSFKDAAFMGIMRWTFYDKLKETYDNVRLAYGYITKNTRIRHGLPKEHYVDARCISNHPLAENNDSVFYFEKMRCHKRKIHQCKIYKHGKRKSENTPHVGEFMKNSKVKYQNKVYLLTGFTGNRAYLQQADGKRLKNPINVKYLTLVESPKNYMVKQVPVETANRNAAASDKNA